MVYERGTKKVKKSKKAKFFSKKCWQTKKWMIRYKNACESKDLEN